MAPTTFTGLPWLSTALPRPSTALHGLPSQAALPRLASLMTLDLSHNDLGDAALEALSQLGAKDGLGAAPALRFLHLDAVGATDKGVSALSNAVLAAGGLVALRALFLRGL